MIKISPYQQSILKTLSGYRGGAISEYVLYRQMQQRVQRRSLEILKSLGMIEAETPKRVTYYRITKRGREWLRTQ